MRAMLAWLWSILGKPVPVGLFGRVVEPPLILVLLVVVGIVAYQPIKHWWLQDEWRTFTHDQYSFSIDYPASWSVNSYGDYGSRGLDYLRARFSSFFGGAVSIHQQPMENPELADAVEWGEAVIQHADGHDLSPLSEVRIGQGDYPALTRTYRRGNVLPELRRVFYVVSEDSAFMLEFAEADQESAAPVFERMLASFHLFDKEVSE
jgi:hypothetical protein